MESSVAVQRRSRQVWKFLKNVHVTTFLLRMSTASKKRKPAAAHPDPQPTKKAKITVKNGEKSKTKDKGKARESDAEAEFQTVTASLVVSVPPIFASNPHAGVQEMLDSMIMRLEHVPHVQVGHQLSIGSDTFQRSEALFSPILISRF